MTSSRVLVGLFSPALAIVLMACGDDVDPNPNPRRNQTTNNTSLGLSAGYKSNCERCHGERGDGTTGYPSLPGNKDEAGFIALVRAGKGDMPAFDASQISDADLKADYTLLKNR